MNGNEFALSPMEIVFLIVAIVVTIPFVVFIRWILKQLKEEEGDK